MHNQLLNGLRTDSVVPPDLAAAFTTINCLVRVFGVAELAYLIPLLFAWQENVNATGFAGAQVVRYRANLNTILTCITATAAQLRLSTVSAWAAKVSSRRRHCAVTQAFLTAGVGGWGARRDCQKKKHSTSKPASTSACGTPHSISPTPALCAPCRVC